MLYFPNWLPPVLNVQPKPISNMIDVGAQVQQVINVECRGVFFEPVLLEIKFQSVYVPHLSLSLSLSLFTYCFSFSSFSLSFFSLFCILFISFPLYFSGLYNAYCAHYNPFIIIIIIPPSQYVRGTPPSRPQTACHVLQVHGARYHDVTGLLPEMETAADVSHSLFRAHLNPHYFFR